MPSLVVAHLTANLSCLPACPGCCRTGRRRCVPPLHCRHVCGCGCGCGCSGCSGCSRGCDCKRCCSLWYVHEVNLIYPEECGGRVGELSHKVWGTEGMCARSGAAQRLAISPHWLLVAPRCPSCIRHHKCVRRAHVQGRPAQGASWSARTARSSLRKCLTDQLTCYRSIFVALQACGQDGCARLAKSPPPPHAALRKADTCMPCRHALPTSERLQAAQDPVAVL